jgi:hypothetical protein
MKVSFSFLLMAFTLCCGLSACKGTPASGTVLLQDDFSTNQLQWNTQIAPDSETRLAEGVFEIEVLGSQLNVWASPAKQTFSAVSINVTAASPSGVLENGFGVLCGLQDAEHFFFFLISSDGYYGIGQRKAGKTVYLHDSSGDMSPSPYILPAPQANLLQATCNGTQLSLRVNGQNLAEIELTDGQVPKGEVALLAKSLFEGGFTAQFDNLTITQP